MKIGFGYDIHRLVQGRKLIIGGVEIPFSLGEDGYSDGDVLIHAVIDALLGASGLGDIGTHFPSGNKEYKDISSRILLCHTRDMVTSAGYSVNNLDCTVILEKPILSPFRNAIIQCLSEDLHIPGNSVSLKAKTKEGMDDTGAGKSIEAYAVVLIEVEKL
ncbi:MAG: 2-C-methyl-D-erythritol 2,4-cyclodiphosphate synthase [Spirochaetales bacterium]|nr:2-C-methyl-D-erythritol 2,4-cyclodiphosphate synthase [Spirochaetales bacterium]